MKNILLAVTMTAAISSTYAQKSKVVSAYNYNKSFNRNNKCTELQKGLDAINLAKDHDVTKSWAKTWKYRGDLYYSALVSSKSDACKELSIGALEECTDSYMKTLVYNFKDPELKKIELEKEDGSGFMKFMGALQNKAKVDDEMYVRDIMGRKLPALSGEYANKGITQFTAKDYKGAQESFGKSMLLSQFVGKLDTVIMYNMALASEYAEDYKSAHQVYDGLIAMKYNVDGNGPNLYLSQASIYKKEGNTEKVAEYIDKGRIAYPTNQNLIFQQIDTYLASGQNEKAINSLNNALELDAENGFLYYVRGTVNEKLKNMPAAIKDYNTAIEKDPKQHDALYNLGAYYFNQGAEKNNEANDLPLSATAKYKALNDESKSLFKQSIPFIEKANALKPEDTATAEMLINAYTRVGEYDKAKTIKTKYQ